MPPPPSTTAGGSNFDKMKMGALMGTGVGLTIGFIFGSFSILRGGPGPRGALATLSQYMLSSAATFGFFMSIGSRALLLLWPLRSLWAMGDPPAGELARPSSPGSPFYQLSWPSPSADLQVIRTDARHALPAGTSPYAQVATEPYRAAFRRAQAEKLARGL
ncbi:hypothetical protein A1Q2_06175 [Trichosporon asahii var. asahii CBS 8904]|uniref:Protein mgr2 n=2 Tax=Trichosporon asahii var. asahii TaxID=189963 RepID=K1VS59_TRIAC|nr:hypothetical protein A1Q1_02970 [Trichosporon asahii var. asahii CBS 2479]EJT48054.1 hypothetical protein A1Q1_02970 [Trichosporon asahii var. asahii CBS 2479]EKC99512.1 hypothetical protein A1Q2_06175 [Trichosporon asahii var. asahii CBS 8904]